MGRKGEASSLRPRLSHSPILPLPSARSVVLNCVLRDNALYGPAAPKLVDGDFLGAYHAYTAPGLEVGPGRISLCYSDDLRHWVAGEPILCPEDGAGWEPGGLYKPWLLEHAGVYYLFHNAKNLTDGRWIEQTGLATSRDLVHWERHPGNPILPVGPAGAFDHIFASDPCVFRHGEL